MINKSRKKSCRSFALLLLLILIVSLFGTIPAFAAGESSADDHAVLDLSIHELDGKRVAIMTGSPQDEAVRQCVKDVELLYFNSNTDCLMALREKKADFYVNNTIQFPFVRQEYPEFSYINEAVIVYQNGAIFSKNDRCKALRDEFNAFLAEITESGRLDELKEYWLNPRDWETLDIPDSGEKGTVHMCTCTAMKPFAFVYNNHYAGFDIAVVAEFCRDCGYGLDIKDADFSGMISGIATGKFDVAAGQIAWTEERAKSAYYSELYVEQTMVPFVRTADYVEGLDSGDEDVSFWDSVQNSFRRTFIDEDRWQIVLEGLGVTLLITVFGFVLANLFGALFCAMTLSDNRVLRVIADIYSRIMQGTPIVVILMILYYIIFGNSDLSGVVISIFGFGLSTGAYLAQIFSGSIQSIDRGQTEAALTLGLTKFRAFTGIVLPQAIRAMLPGYFSQLIALMKGTSIVGYIAVQDLTKAGDIIRSSTYEAFFPLIASAVIYFIISSLLLSLLKAIQKKLSPRRSVM